MADDDLRQLERAARDAPGDVTTWTRYVRALDQRRATPPADLAGEVERIRATFRRPGQLADPRIEVGDEVRVEEHDTPWILGPWRGVVTEVRSLKDEHDEPCTRYRVRPIFPDESDPDAEPIPFRVKPLPEQRVRGLELSREDRVELIARRPP